MMTLLQQIDDCWEENNGERRVQEWTDALKKNEKKIAAAAKKFHEWEPLHVYLSVTRAMSAGISFSLRYKGQEVAELIVNDDVQLKISAKNDKNNKEYFANYIGIPSKFSWQSADAAEFRKYFKNVCLRKPLKSQEHEIESEFLKQMADDTIGKFSGTLKNIQPVLMAGYPFQFPLPISGNTGKPQPPKGNIDILARRGIGKGTRISIWELKRPGTTAHAIEQTYIYSVSLIKMLRLKPWGDFWYNNIIGFKGEVPAELTIESVIAVCIKSERERLKFTSKLQKFKMENPLMVGNDSIKLHLAYYQEGPLRVEEGIQEI